MASTPQTASPFSLPQSLSLWFNHEKHITVSIRELAALSTKSKISKLLRPRILLVMFITALIILGYWLLLPVMASPVPRLPVVITPPTSSPYADYNHLVVVAGHAIWKGGPMLGEVDEEWTLEPYQKGHNESLTWIEHIEKGVEIASQNKSILIFSGGETRQTSGPRTEAQSYWSLAEARGLLKPDIFSVATTEIYARDSLENLLFSICRFKEYTGRYPEFVTVVGYEFKRRRFSQIHRAAILFPEERFTYIGIDPRNESLVEKITKFENTHSLLPFEKDPYACFDEVLIEKKINRGWSQRGWGSYDNSCPELRSLLRYCGLQSDGAVKLFNEPLPWT